MNSTYFTEEHNLFRQTLRDFLAREVTPHIDEWEEKGELPREIYRRFGEMGYFGLGFPEKYGGMELDYFYSLIFSEELVRVNSGGFGASIGAHPGLALGTPRRRSRPGRPLARRARGRPDRPRAEARPARARARDRPR